MGRSFTERPITSIVAEDYCLLLISLMRNCNEALPR